MVALTPGEYPPAVAAVRPNPAAFYRNELAKYQIDLTQYESDSQQYKDDKKEFDKHVKKSREIAQRLNERFAGWYYVISTQNLKQLALKRSEIVEKKTESKAKPPGFSFPGLKQP